ncbi:ATP-dependent RNA helicase DDX24 [Bufo gargarizans]|uniref:ATP-dependent RNA helicase DDX24 n=1 Tax=Bufo gargarizans TaxID=30331 RepID=UPI001CF15136|nr:ATP-dependent RNA helicase DDX24 [Bufo gargarizans]
MKPQKGKKKVGLAQIKLKRKGIKITGKWKPISLDPNLLADGNMEEIICFEELTDYTLVKTSKELVAKRKRKHSADEEEEEEEQQEGKATSKKKNKKTKKIFEGKKEREESDNEMEDFFWGEEKDDYEEEDEEEQEDLDLTVPGEEEAKALKEEENPKPPKNKKKKRKKKSKVKGDKREGEKAVAVKPAKKTKNWAAGPLAGEAGKNVDVSAWTNLYVPPPVLKALSYLGFSTPTPIQALALPSAIRDKMDILGAAETGSGKTLAFAIPMIHSILQWRKVQENEGSGEEEKEGGDEETADKETDMAEDLDKDEEKEEGEADEEVDDDDDEKEEDDDDYSTMGCVKVVKNVNINFNAAPQCDTKRPLLGLVVTPTRELAVQVKHHIDAVARFTGIKATIVVGGMAPQKQERVLNRRPEIVIATPGRLWEMIKERHPHLCNLRQLRCLVIDEADRMVEKGHYAELAQLLEMLSDSHYNPKRQTFVFSATLTLIHQAPSRLLQKKNFKKLDKEGKLESLMGKIGLKGKPKVIDLTRKQATVETLTETRIHCTGDEKDYYLYYFLLQYPGRTMVFANSIDCIKRLTSLLAILECNTLPLHANMHQKQRLKNLERFAERESCVLLTTDVAARGLDIPNIQHVLHYQVPRTSETYVHRSGRTARASSDGLTLLLIGPDDMINYRKIFRTLEKNDDLPLFPVESKCMDGIKERVNFARQIEKMEYFNGKAKQQNSWILQAAEALDLELDDDDLIGGKQDEQEDLQKQKALKMMKKQLKRLLSQPIFRNVMKTKYPTQSGQLPVPCLPLSKAESALHTLAESKSKTKRKKHKA